MLVIGLGYEARNGKDTVAQTIIETFGGQYNIKRFALADPLKAEINQMAVEAGGMPQLFSQLRSRGILPPNVAYDPDPDMSDPMSPLGKQRPLLQFWGQYKRSLNVDHWVDLLEQRVLFAQPDVAIISDLRHLNEFWWVKDKYKGVTCEVHREGFHDPKINKSHVSETELIGAPFDYKINVLDGHLDELKRDAVTFFELIIASMTPPTDFTLETMEREAEAIDQATALYNRVQQESGINA